MKTIVYVLYHDDESMRIAKENFGDCAWARLLFIETTIYYESVFFIKKLDELRDEWKDADWVGMITYKAREKTKVPRNLEEYTELATKNSCDYLALHYFYPHEVNGRMLYWSDIWHPHFLHLWSQMCSYLGYDFKVYMSDEIPAFYCNYWITRPSVMEEYIALIKRAYDYLETAQHIREMLFSDSMYRPKFVPVYNNIVTYHPFLLERLPCLFFWARNAKPMFIR